MAETVMLVYSRRWTTLPFLPRNSGQYSWAIYLFVWDKIRSLLAAAKSYSLSFDLWKDNAANYYIGIVASTVVNWVHLSLLTGVIPHPGCHSAEVLQKAIEVHISDLFSGINPPPILATASTDGEASAHLAATKLVDDSKDDASVLCSSSDLSMPSECADFFRTDYCRAHGCAVCSHSLFAWIRPCPSTVEKRAGFWWRVGHTCSKCYPLAWHFCCSWPSYYSPDQNHAYCSSAVWGDSYSQVFFANWWICFLYLLERWLCHWWWHLWQLVADPHCSYSIQQSNFGTQEIRRHNRQCSSVIAKTCMLSQNLHHRWHSCGPRFEAPSQCIPQGTSRKTVQLTKSCSSCIPPFLQQGEILSRKVFPQVQNGPQSSPETIEAAWEQLEKDCLLFCPSSGLEVVYSSVTKAVHSKLASIKQKPVSDIAWFKALGADYHQFTPVVEMYLSIPPGTPLTESSFSTAGWIKTKLHGRLSVSNTEILVVIKRFIESPLFNEAELLQSIDHYLADSETPQPI